MDKKILVLFAGGIMGSVVNSDGARVFGEGSYELLMMYRRIFPNEVKFECRRILEVTSAQFTAESWERLMEVIRNIDTDNYQGIIITVPSDALPYTGALFGMFYRHIEIPMIITSCNKAVGEKGSNAVYNFAAAVELITKPGYSGIFISYENIYIATRLMPADNCTGIFRAYGEDSKSPNPIHRSINKQWLYHVRKRLFHTPLKFDNKIFALSAIPGMELSILSFKKKPAAVLLRPYHHGGACLSASESVKGFVEDCLMQDIKVYICELPESEKDSAKDLLLCGCIPMGDISMPSAYAKLLIAYNQKEYPVGEVLKKNLYFERVGEKCSE